MNSASARSMRAARAMSQNRSVFIRTLRRVVQQQREAAEDRGAAEQLQWGRAVAEPTGRTIRSATTETVVFTP
jgi:hypothetical protein